MKIATDCSASHDYYRTTVRICQGQFFAACKDSRRCCAVCEISPDVKPALHPQGLGLTRRYNEQAQTGGAKRRGNLRRRRWGQSPAPALRTPFSQREKGAGRKKGESATKAAPRTKGKIWAVYLRAGALADIRPPRGWALARLLGGRYRPGEGKKRTCRREQDQHCRSTIQMRGSGAGWGIAT